MKTATMPLQEKFMFSVYKKLIDPFIEEYGDIKILVGDWIQRDEIHPFAAIWKGKQSKPFQRFIYRSNEERNNAIKKAKNTSDERIAYKDEKRLKRANSKPNFEVGDVFVSSWGYGQTNVDAYQVIEKPSVHFAIIQPIALESVPDTQGHDCENVRPIKNSFLNYEPTRKKVVDGTIKINSFAWANKWDGKRDFYKSWYY